jgi:hypothetical protein
MGKVKASLTAEDVRAELTRSPFVPFRFHLKDGRTFDVPHRDVAHTLPYGVLVLLGLKEGTHQADGYDRFPYEHINRIEHLPRKRNHRSQRKAS